MEIEYEDISPELKERGRAVMKTAYTSGIIGICMLIAGGLLINYIIKGKKYVHVS